MNVALTRAGSSLYATLERVAVFIVLGLLWEKAVDIFAIKPYLLPPLSSVLQSVWHNRVMLLDQASNVLRLEASVGHRTPTFTTIVRPVRAGVVTANNKPWVRGTAFGQRRKTLWNCLKSLDLVASDRELAQALVECGIERVRRGETLSLAEFALLSKSLPLCQRQHSFRCCC